MLCRTTLLMALRLSALGLLAQQPAGLLVTAPGHLRGKTFASMPAEFGWSVDTDVAHGPLVPLPIPPSPHPPIPT